MAYTVYVLKSRRSGRFYIGSSADVARRVAAHNAGRNRSTRGRGRWDAVYTESFETKEEAQRRERDLKRMKSHVFLEMLIERKKVSGSEDHG